MDRLARSSALLSRPPWPLAGFLMFLLFLVFVVDPRVPVWAPYWKVWFLDLVVGTLNPIGNGVTLLLVCAALAVGCHVFRWSRLRTAAWLGVLAFACAGLLEFAVKHLVGRPRPDADLDVFTILGPTLVPDADSFPSGHATSAFAVARVFAAYFPWLTWPLYLVAAGIAAGRVYLERHYVSDIVIGASIGLIVASRLLRVAMTRGVTPPTTQAAV